MSGESGHDLSNLKAAKTPIVEFIEGFSPTEGKIKLFEESGTGNCTPLTAMNIK